MGSKISVVVQLGEGVRHGEIRVERELGFHMVRDGYAPFRALDVPSPKAHPFSKLLCTDAVTIQRVTESRERVAAALAQELTAAILEAMAANDTEMGYKK